MIFFGRYRQRCSTVACETIFLSLKRDSRPTVDVDCKTAVFLRIQVRASSQTKGSAARLKMESETAKRRKKYSRPGSSKDGYV